MDHSLLAMFDSQLRSAISASLFGNLPDHSWWQATTGVLFGGLGFRTAQSVALLTFIANRLVSRPLVRTLLEHFGAPLPLLQRACDRRTEDAVLSLISTPAQLWCTAAAAAGSGYGRARPAFVLTLSATVRRPHPPAPRPLLAKVGASRPRAGTETQNSHTLRVEENDETNFVGAAERESGVV